MLQKARMLDRRIFARQCVLCGYDGALLRGGQAPRCARCGCDLQERPARSYAEMEGLVGQPVTLLPPPPSSVRQERLIHRWLAFLFLMMIGTLAIFYLAAAALAV